MATKPQPQSVSATAAIDQQESRQDISKKTVCLKIHLSSLGNRKKVSNWQVEVEADKSLIRVSKVLLDSPQLQAIKKLDGEIRQFIYGNCLPFESGIHFLPFPLIEKVNDALVDFQKMRQELVEKFVEAYPMLCQSASERLRALYNASDYPPVETIQAKFTMSWRYVNFGVPGQLKNISVEIFKNEREKAQKMMAEAAADIQQVMRTTLSELVSNLRDKLTDDPEGKPRRLRDSSITKLREFIDSFDFRNVVDDAELKEQVEKARRMISGIDAPSLRSTEALRDQVQAGMTEISAKLETMIVTGPRRKFRVDEEEAQAA